MGRGAVEGGHDTVQRRTIDRKLPDHDRARDWCYELKHIHGSRHSDFSGPRRKARSQIHGVRVLKGVVQTLDRERYGVGARGAAITGGSDKVSRSLRHANLHPAEALAAVLVASLQILRPV